MIGDIARFGVAGDGRVVLNGVELIDLPITPDTFHLEVRAEVSSATERSVALHIAAGSDASTTVDAHIAPESAVALGYALLRAGHMARSLPAAGEEGSHGG